MDDSGRPDLIDDSHWNRVLAEYRRRVSAGEKIDDEQFASEHPDLADALRSWFATSSQSGGSHDKARSGDDAHSTMYNPLTNRETIPPSEKPCAEAPAGGLIGETIGRYRIVRCIGRGAMGSVYLAEDSQLDREVALKIPKFTPDDGPEMIERFYREARAAATLRHANVCPVHDVGEFNGMHYLSMAYIEGHPLAELIRSEKNLPERRAVEIVLKLARALAAAHSEGVIHRDLKPANVMIDEHDEPIIMDFGLARRVNRDDARLTQAGLVVGSPAYMSPEQVEGNLQTMGVGCDIYSLGVIFYELLTGEIPFKGSIAAVMGQIITSPPKPPSQVRKGVDPRLEAICLKMMAKKISDRYPSMREVVAALENYRTGRSPMLPTDAAVANGALLRARQADSTARPTPDDAPRFVLRPWMVWTAVVTVLAGFGVTSWILTLLLQNMNQAGATGPAISQAAQQAFRKQNLELFLDGRRIGQEKFNEPLDLTTGEHLLEIRSGETVKKSEAYSVPPGKVTRLQIEFVDDIFTIRENVVDIAPEASSPDHEAAPDAKEPASGSGETSS